MSKKEEILHSFLDAWDQQDLDTCMSLVADDGELHSTYALSLFPESKGVLHGKEMIKEYLILLFKGMRNVELVEREVQKVDEYYVVRGNNDGQTLNYYLHYYINDDNLFYLVKSNMTQPKS